MSTLTMEQRRHDFEAMLRRANRVRDAGQKRREMYPEPEGAMLARLTEEVSELCYGWHEAAHRAGMRPGTRSGIWEAMAHAIEEIKPHVVVWENVAGARSAAAYSRLESGPGRLGGGQTDLFSGLSDVWSETWPASGMTRRGSLYGPPTSEPLTGASGSSSSRGVPTLPTPSASCATGPGEHGDGGMNLQAAVASLLT